MSTVERCAQPSRLPRYRSGLAQQSPDEQGASDAPRNLCPPRDVPTCVSRRKAGERLPSGAGLASRQ
jgi:hypothetical protein